MSEKLNILLGQRMLPNGKVRLHWQLDGDYYPAKPLSSVNINDKIPLIPVEERWLEGNKAKFEAFTIPYYDYIYMKDMDVQAEAYIVQPFEHDVVVLDVELNGDLLREAFTVKKQEGEDSIVLFNEDSKRSVILEFEVVAGLNKQTGKPYTRDEVIAVDMAIGFKDIWKEDLGKVVEAYTYATLVNQNSLDNAKEQGDTKHWGE